MNQKLHKSNAWSGRIDSNDPDSLRWHQVVKAIVYEEVPLFDDKWILIGFSGDEGVRRNNGRVGAKNGPESIRKAASSLPIPRPDFVIPDLGDFVAETDLQNDQNELSEVISGIHSTRNRSILIGGGHEITYPHFKGLKKAYPDKRIGILNIDAHYDLRAVDTEIGPTSGTGFYQILREYPDTGYLILGVNDASNTQVLKERARQCGVRKLTLFDMEIMPIEDILYQVRLFAQEYDILYLTVCMDAFSAAYAPGVSAPAAFGLTPDARFFSIFREIHRLNKIQAFDIAEVNPNFDLDSRTSRLAAQLLYYWMV